MSDQITGINRSKPPFTDSQTRTKRAKGVLIIIGVLAAITDILSYPLIHSMLEAGIIATYQYVLLITSYFVWKRTRLKIELPRFQRGRRYALIYIFTLIFFFVYVYAVIAISNYFPAILGFPGYVNVLIVVVPAFLTGIPMGNFIFNHYNYSRWLNGPI